MAPQPPRSLRPNQSQVASYDRQRVVPGILARLKQVGIDLELFQWTFDRTFADGTGFYFSSGAYKQLINAAEESRKTEINFEDLPANDTWAKQLVSHIGFIEKGATEPVVIEFSLTRIGDCRAYYLPHFSKQRGEGFRQLVLKAAHDDAVYNEIARRLLACNPPVILDDHIGRIQKFGKTTLDGVNFFARDYKKLKQTLVDAKDGSGSPFFGHAILDNLDHWALKISFLATDGTGFREASRLKMGDKPLIGDPERDGVPEGIRTPDPRFRKPVLYPAELPGLGRSHTVQSRKEKARHEAGLLRIHCGGQVRPPARPGRAPQPSRSGGRFFPGRPTPP